MDIDKIQRQKMDKIQYTIIDSSELATRGLTTREQTKRQLELELATWMWKQTDIQQHSEEWHTMRHCTIGGSSLSTIMGTNPYEDVRTFIAKRIGLVPDTMTGMAANWGNLFEDIICEYSEEMFGTKVRFPNAFIMQGRLSYSPDGLAVIDDPRINPEPIIVLMEFKCPATRKITSNPPKYYIPQCKMGLDMIPIAKIACLLEAVFRLSSWEDLTEGNLKCRFLSKQYMDVTEVLKFGFLGMYMLEADKQWDMERIDSFLLRYLSQYDNYSSRESTNDLSNIKEDTFTEMLNLINKRKIKLYHPPKSWQADPSKAIEDYYKSCEPGVYPLGVLGWKLLKVNYHLLYPEKDYVKPHMDKIIEITDLLFDCCKPENANLKQYKYDCWAWQ